MKRGKEGAGSDTFLHPESLLRLGIRFVSADVSSGGGGVALGGSMKRKNDETDKESFRSFAKESGVKTDREIKRTKTIKNLGTFNPKHPCRIFNNLRNCLQHTSVKTSFLKSKLYFPVI